MRMKIETGIERVSCTPVANFAAAISSGDKKSSAAILSSQFETMFRRNEYATTNQHVVWIHIDEERIVCRHGERLNIDICLLDEQAENSCQCSDHHDHSQRPRTSRSATLSSGRLFDIHRFVEEHDKWENNAEKNHDDNKQCVPDERKRNTIASCSVCVTANCSSCVSHIQREEADCRNGYGQR